jgi:farnesyl-diphosphate farnesyltransferase
MIPVNNIFSFPNRKKGASSQGKASPDKDRIWREQLLRNELKDLDGYINFVLTKVSRTFALNIQILPSRLRFQVLLAYLFCRMADTIEDDKNLIPEKKVLLLTRFRDLFPCQESWEEKVHVLTGQLPHTWKDSQQWDHLLIYHSKWIFRLYSRLPEKAGKIIATWVREMCKGMAEFTANQREVNTRKKFLITTIGELDRYCYYVAGTVGNLLCELFYYHSHLITRKINQRLQKFSASFGLGLQLTNILKDVCDDMDRNILFIPHSLMKDYDLTVDSLSAPENSNSVTKMTRQLIKKAQSHLKDAMEYICSIPRLEPRLRLFCLWPLFMAVDTLILLSENGSVFHAKDKVKITRLQVKTILKQTSLVCMSNMFIRRIFKTKMMKLERLISQPI